MQSGTTPLEDHFRNLILTNPRAEPGPGINSSHASAFTDASPGEDVGGGQSGANTLRPPARGGKKRPNQAQRRQMNAELSIPFDPRETGHSYSQQRPQGRHRGGQQSFQHNHSQSSVPSPTSASPHEVRDRGSVEGSHSYGQSRGSHVQFPTSSSVHQADWRQQQHIMPGGSFRPGNIVPTNTFTLRGGRHSTHYQSTSYNPTGYRHSAPNHEELTNQSAFLDRLCSQIIADAEIGPQEIVEKESFRKQVEAICQHVVAHHEYAVADVREFRPETVELKCFGSLASGFATKAADMDLGLLSPTSRLPPNSPESPIPRLIEKALLTAGFGARLLTKTRVPILKLCQNPSPTLLQGLLDARTKWENGIDIEREPDNDAPEDSEFLDTRLPVDDEPKQTLTELETPAVWPCAVGLSRLKQSPNQSLANYYTEAKRFLRRLNGRDITHSNSQNFTDADFSLLDAMCRVFVEGLYDTELKNRISAYPSFHIGDVTLRTNRRSLAGINTMIEGEKLVLLWETGQLFGPKADPATESKIRQWKDLQYSKDFGTNPIWFKKELQQAVTILHQIPSIQLLQLQQDPYESPTAYHERAYKMATGLLRASSGADVWSEAIRQYVNGVRNAQIKSNLGDFISSTGTRDLRTVARQHMALHLAADYERAIDRGCYREDQHAIIQAYIAILRRKPVRSIQRPTDFEYVIPITQNEAVILWTIKELPDPATLRPNKPRDRYSDSLGFPKTGVGVQCDVNFSAYLALQNTLLLRCYSYTDPRVRPLVLFVKHWAKARNINTPYRGTLSSYGYVLMVLHFLINVAEPFVCPNLQELGPPGPDIEGITTCQGYNVRFWREEREIQSLAERGQLNQNRDSLGTLLRGFFDYYAQGGMMATLPRKAFDWGRDVISPRTHGGLLSKAEKGWTGAKTVVQAQGGAPDTPIAQSPFLNSNNKDKAPQTKPDQSPSLDRAADSPTEQHAPKPKEFKEVRHRFLFAIEDPFELEHNVARTVTHNGIVAIRDEFRRAWRIISAAGRGQATDDLLEDVVAKKEGLEKGRFVSLLHEIHGDEQFSEIAAV